MMPASKARVPEMLPEDYMARCLQIATEALKKIAEGRAECWDDCPPGVLPCVATAQQALNEMRRLP